MRSPDSLKEAEKALEKTSGLLLGGGSNKRRPAANDTARAMSPCRRRLP